MNTGDPLQEPGLDFFELKISGGRLLFGQL